jgi:hypothetical protein
MSLVTANGFAVIGGTILMPLVGVWTADLTIDVIDGSGFAAGTAVTLACADGGFSLSCTVDAERTGDFLNTIHVRLVGGADGMGKTTQARAYAQPNAFARDVLNGLCADTGESLSTTADATLLSTNLVAWMATPRPAADVIKVLLDIVAPTYSWRFLADGTLWVGTEAWPASSAQFELITQDPVCGWFDLGVDTPAIMPGDSLSGVGNVSRVLHTIDGTSIRSRVWVDLNADRGIPAMMDDQIEGRVAKFDYHALYECQVTAQSADLTTVDIQPVPPADQTITGTQRVQVRAGAGITVQFTPGAKVLLGWRDGNPQLPYVTGMTGDSSPQTFKVGAQSIQLAGNTPAARQGDPGDGGMLLFTPNVPPAGAAVLAYIPPPGPYPPHAPPIVQIPISIKITGGSSIVGLG